MSIRKWIAMSLTGITLLGPLNIAAKGNSAAKSPIREKADNGVCLPPIPNYEGSPHAKAFAALYTGIPAEFLNEGLRCDTQGHEAFLRGYNSIFLSGVVPCSKSSILESQKELAAIVAADFFVEKNRGVDKEYAACISAPEGQTATFIMLMLKAAMNGGPFTTGALAAAMYKAEGKNISSEEAFKREASKLITPDLPFIC